MIFHEYVLTTIVVKVNQQVIKSIIIALVFNDLHVVL